MTISCSLVRLNVTAAPLLSLSLETSVGLLLGVLLLLMLLLLLLLLVLPGVASMGTVVLLLLVLLLLLLTTVAASARVGSVLHARLSQIDRNNKIRNFDK